MDVPALLRSLRTQTCLRQSELAERAGTSRAAVCAYESGAKVPSVRTLARLAEVCGFEVVGTLRPLTAELDRRLDAARDGGPPESWPLLALAGELDAHGAQWAFDRDTALALTGLHLTLEHTDLVLRFDDAARGWLRAARVFGTDEHGFPGNQSWWDVDLAAAGDLLARRQWTPSGWTRIRLVEALPPAVAVALDGRTVPVLPPHEVERGDPELARLLARLRERR